MSPPSGPSSRIETVVPRACLLHLECDLNVLPFLHENARPVPSWVTVSTLIFLVIILCEKNPIPYIPRNSRCLLPDLPITERYSCMVRSSIPMPLSAMTSRSPSSVTWTRPSSSLMYPSFAAVFTAVCEFATSSLTADPASSYDERDMSLASAAGSVLISLILPPLGIFSSL